MELAFQASRSGLICCRAGSLYLHSAYDPAKEAERFLDSVADGRSPTCFIIAGPCLDYLSPAVRRRFGTVRIVSIQYDARFRDGRPRDVLEGGADAVWYPDGAVTREAFLEACLPGDALGGVVFLEWPPASQAYPLEAERTREAVKSVLDRLASSDATLKAFGRAWIWNACRNVLHIGSTLTATAADCPIVVAAAGPSLSEALRPLLPHRDRFLLFSVSSALAACRAAGLDPDLVVASDGGFWSRLHLYPLAGQGSPVAMPLTASPSASLSARMPCLLLTQGNFPEPELAPLLGGGIAIPGHGTVSGTALRLAALLGRGPILVAGMDLASRGIVSHAAPHGFDPVTRDAQGRLSPLETLVQAREAPLAPLALSERPWRTSRSLTIYAEALGAEALLPPFAGRLWRLSPSPVALAGYATLEAREADVDAFFAGLPSDVRRPATGFLSERKPAPEASRRAALAREFERWRALASDACAALSAGALPASERACEFLKAVDLPWWAASCRAVASGEAAGPAARELEAGALAFVDELRERLI